MWEFCSGTSSLSAKGRQQAVPHLPPIDFRYGWYLGRREDQLLSLWALIFVGVETLFASPNCAPWGNHTRGLPREVLAAKRQLETPCLEFIAVCCFVQLLLGRRYLLENSAYSDI